MNSENPLVEKRTITVISSSQKHALQMSASRPFTTKTSIWKQVEARGGKQGDVLFASVFICA